MLSRSFVFLVLISFFGSIPAFSQTAAPKNATGASLLRSSISAMTNGVPISDATLTGTATRTYGSDVETGTVTLMTLGCTAGRVDLALTKGLRSEIISQLQSTPAGQWSGPNGTSHAMAQQNCWEPAAWFFPPLALAAALNNPSVAIAYLGEESLGGETVQHVRFWDTFTSSSGTSTALVLFSHLTTVDVYLDAATSLPVVLDFTIHPDHNELLNLPVKISYSNYQKVNGVLIPLHIKKFLNGGIVLDLNLTGASFNTGLSQSEFAISASSGSEK